MCVVNVVSHDADLDQDVFVLYVDGNLINFTYWDYGDEIDDVYTDLTWQINDRLSGILTEAQIQAVSSAVYYALIASV